MTFNNDGQSSKDDITDIVDMTETLRAPRAHVGRDVIDMPSDADSGARKGVFLQTKPRVDPVPEPKASLRSRFMGKRPAAAVDAPAEPTLEAVAPVKAAQITPAEPTPAAPPKQARAWFGKKASKAVEEPEVPASADAPRVETPARAEGPVGPTKKVKTPIVVSRVTEKKKPTDLPIRVLIGFLSEVSEREAREYALGVADRNCQQISLVYFDAFKFGNGAAYEIHEGGNGRAYLPEIIKAFEANGTYRKGGVEDASVFIPTATRTVQVSRTAEGLQAFMLPESSTESGTAWLQGTTKMSPAMPTLVPVLVAGAALFITGFLGMSVAMISRIQPFEAAPTPIVENVSEGFANSPLSRWAALQSVSGDEYVKAVRFANGKWEIQRGTSTAPSATTPAANGADSLATPQAANPAAAMPANKPAN